MQGTNSKCPICNVLCNDSERVPDFDLYFFECNNCGRFVISASQRDINKDLYAHFLFYNNKISLPKEDERFFYFIGRQNTFDYLVKKYPYSQLLKVEMLEVWYPKNLNERVDYILTGLAKLSDYPGKQISLPDEYIKSLFFINRFSDGKSLPMEECNIQIDYISNHMLSQNLLKKEINLITILPEGWRRIAELQKYTTNSKQAFVAMSFSDDMKTVQEAIEEGIRRAGYIPHVMNKSEHNKQIVPEILYQIKQSKFVVAEFSNNNNGAYYEAGYAAGLGKEVIHICNSKIFNDEGHFDIKQKSAVLWQTEDEIAELLFKRIEATIGNDK